MTFEEWWTQRGTVARWALNDADNASAAWGYQQERIEKLEWNLNNVKHALEEQKKLNSVLNGRLEAFQDELEDKCRNINNLRRTIADLTEKLDIERNGTEYVTSDVKCKSHPDAPHGYNRDLSHAEGRYVCECEHWEPDECLFDTQEEHDRYSLEQSIMSCWGITDDLHLLADAMQEGEHKRMHHEMLLNLSQLYELKFQKLSKEYNEFFSTQKKLNANRKP